jgi:NAD-dependent deacetylase
MGTSAAFEYIVHWAVRAKAAGGRLIEVNPEETELSGKCDVCLRGPAGVILPQLLERTGG